MDIPRTKSRRIPGWGYIGGALAIGLIGLLGLGRLQKASPVVERTALWVDQVKRGPMVREVRGPGRLLPEQTRWVTADTSGRVERIEVRPGAPVAADAVLLVLSNPDVMLQALESERQLANAQAELLNLKTTLESQRLSEEAQLASLRAELADARRRAGADERLERQQMLSEVEARQAAERAAQLTSQVDLAQKRLQVTADGLKERLAAQRTQVEKLQAVVQFRQRQVESLRVRAGQSGVLQDLPLELGQWVTPGTLLAKVIRPEALKAELRIPEIQARDLQLGQVARIDTRNGVVQGEVARIAPAANQGTVRVEVRLPAELPRGARPDLTVEGTIELERLPDVLYVGRPAGALPESTLELFRLSQAGDLASRVKVHLGRGSVSTIEIRDGLNEGDRVVLSDMSAWESAEELKLK